MRGGDLYRLKEVLGRHPDDVIYAHLRPDALLEEAELREMLETLRSENRYLREKLGQEVAGDGVFISMGHT